MKNEERLMAGGYLFGSEEDARAAKEEMGTVEYLEQRIQYQDVDTTLKIYEKAVQEKIFKTPVGYEYLRKIQAKLIKGGVSEEEISPIPLYQVYSTSVMEETPKNRKPIRYQKKDRTRDWLRMSVWINIALAILVVAMFAISAIGDTPNMMNYRSKIVDEYAEWEQELKEREAIVREKEKELNLSE